MNTSKIRSTPLGNSRSTNPIEHQYNRISLALAIFAALCFFTALWGLNGYYTARAVVSMGSLLHLTWLSWGVGWLVHIIISLIEHHLWRLRGHLSSAPPAVLIGIYGLVILVGVLDALTSTLSFLLLAFVVGLPIDSIWTIGTATILAEIIAIFPEPVIVWLVVALWRVVRAG